MSNVEYDPHTLVWPLSLLLALALIAKAPGKGLVFARHTHENSRNTKNTKKRTPVALSRSILLLTVAGDSYNIDPIEISTTKHCNQCSRELDFFAGTIVILGAYCDLMFTGKTHCRNCGHLVCRSCAGKKYTIPR